MKQHTLSIALTAALTMTFAGAVFAAGNAGAGNDNGLPKAGNSRVIVAFYPGAAAGGRNAIRAAGGQVKQEILGTNAAAFEVPTQALNGLKNNPNIEYIEEDFIRFPLATGDTSSTGTPYELGQTVPWGIKAVQADQLSDVYAGNRKLCIIDSGYDGGHEDLNHNAATVTGTNNSGTGNWFQDDNHHGTHVAGTISGLNNAGVGVVGVNPNARLKLHIIKVFNADGWGYSSSLTSAANACKAASANVISMSLGGGGKSKTEERAFASLASGGILSIAAAGNDGNTVLSYPASYASVMSVAAADVAGKWAGFSQYNSAVDISGPGVSVLSTVTSHTVLVGQLIVGSTTYAPGSMDGSPNLSASFPLANFGDGSVVNTAMTNKICLIARGTIDFATKVTNCQNSGGKGAIVYNNVAGGFSGTLGTTVTTIPSVTASQAEGTAMLGQIGQTASISFGQSAPIKYEEYNGTSMATPHVSAVAALVWSYHTNCTGNQIKASLEKSAADLSGSGTSEPVSGTGVTVTYGVGRDNATGYGMVKALAAHTRINSLGCGL